MLPSDSTSEDAIEVVVEPTPTPSAGGLAVDDDTAGVHPHGFYVRQSDRNLTITGEEPDGGEDQAGFHVIAEALAGVGVNAASAPPFTIGVTGRYGAGKTKVLQQIRTALRKHYTGRGPAYIVEFDAGRFPDGEDIRPRLVHAFFRTYEQQHRRPLGALRFFWAALRRHTSDVIWTTLAPFLGLAVLVAALYLGAFSAFGLWDYSFPTIIRLLGWCVSVTVAIPSFAVVSRGILHFARHPMVYDMMRGALCLPDTTTALGYAYTQEKLLQNLFLAMTHGGGKGRRVFLFVDNLDRCPPGRCLEIIDQIFSLMALEGAKEHLVSFISVDKRFLDRVIKNRTRDREEYFEKLFSLEIVVPPVHGPRLRSFLWDIGLKSLSIDHHKKPDSDKTGDKLDDVVFSPQEEEWLAEAIHPTASQQPTWLTPRRIIRLLFAYRFVKYVWVRSRRTSDDAVGVDFKPEAVIGVLLAKATGGTPRHADEFTSRTIGLVHLAAPKRKRASKQAESGGECVGPGLVG
ncbi:MAG: hypothetical protein A3K19_29690 [Lentisphaerae bacterium RIFOXYB12_FULL_65_16]|nr:MAG: hypothetical protein A3K18_33300 [Lentisphaerae bacterium RIFOXYA12_64_32]OGV86501.1 MAG: hypothetical protein A3K19_29690 [Lentisphaerae bacterium RIFOXYB12_FULL_65_16]